MPRPKKAVKRKLRSSGLVDLHFHGAFGTDLMNASPAALDALAKRLWQREGIAAFCPTTLSAPPRELAAAVGRLGRWIRSRSPDAPGAIPLGIHLEGPFVHPHACGAHPPGAVRPLDLRELEQLWKQSLGTLRIVTAAPESLSPGKLRELKKWARARGIVLSLGHSCADRAQAREAFAHGGFTGITHAWNALKFHHRDPGALGEALGNPAIHVELIIDQEHVAPEVIRWTQALHPRTCFVSDCVSAAGTTRGWHRFGSLRVRFARGACRLPNGSLAGGGLLLGKAYARWLRDESRRTGEPLEKLRARTLDCVTQNPLAALGLDLGRLEGRQVEWTPLPRAILR